MERNWLIRTYQKQILGPVSKQKLLDFIQKGSVGVTDEVTSGNGYWFSLREKDLVDKYLHGDIPQSFNPVSEAKSILAFKKNQDKTTSLNSSPPNNRLSDKVTSEPISLPNAEDLEYPDVTSIIEQVAEHPDITILSNLPSMPEALKKKQENERVVLSSPEISVEQVFPDNSDLEYPDFAREAVEVAVEVEEHREFIIELPTEPPVVEEVLHIKPLAHEKKPEKKLLYERKHKTSEEISAKPLAVTRLPDSAPRVVAKELEKRNDNYLFVIFFVILVILFGIFFYYREILNKPLPI
jgi:hypothetical protein